MSIRMTSNQRQTNNFEEQNWFTAKKWPEIHSGVRFMWNSLQYCLKSVFDLIQIMLNLSKTVDIYWKRGKNYCYSQFIYSMDNVHHFRGISLTAKDGFIWYVSTSREKLELNEILLILTYWKAYYFNRNV